MKNKHSLFGYITKGINETIGIFLQECKNVLKDSGVVLIFFIAGLLYPLLYNYVYYNETLHDIPVAVVDLSASSDSRRFVKKLEATKEISVVNCLNMDEAQQLMIQRKAHGIVFIPNDYHKKIAKKETAYISLYENMSCFLVYKNIAMAVNAVMIDDMQQIQIERYNNLGMTEEQSKQMVLGIPYQETVLYNPGGGFASFFIPALLIVIIHQTLFFGIGMLNGTAREEGFFRRYYHNTEGGLMRLVFGKAAAYMFMYLILMAYITVLIPYIFNLPQIGVAWDIFKVMIPFLLATIFFSMTFSVLIRNRETGMVLFLFFSVILIFLSGFAWPTTHFPPVWKYFSYLFPSTFGVQSYLKINSMGATIGQVRFEYVALWIQAGIYFLTAVAATKYLLWKEKQSVKQDVAF